MGSRQEASMTVTWGCSLSTESCIHFKLVQKSSSEGGSIASGWVAGFWEKSDIYSYTRCRPDGVCFKCFYSWSWRFDLLCQWKQGSLVINNTQSMAGRRAKYNSIFIMNNIKPLRREDFVFRRPRNLQDQTCFNIKDMPASSFKGRHTVHEGTSPCNKSRGKIPSVNWSFFLQNLVAATNFGPCNWTYEFKPVWGFGTSPCDLFLETLRVNCLWDKSLRPVPSCKLFRRLVAGTSRRA